MREYRRTQRTDHYIGVSAVTCNRCGRECRLVGSKPSRFGSWGLVEILEQGNNDMIRLDLCGRCSQELVGWIEAARRGRITRASDEERAMQEAT